MAMNNYNNSCLFLSNDRNKQHPFVPSSLQSEEKDCIRSGLMTLVKEKYYSNIFAKDKKINSYNTKSIDYILSLDHSMFSVNLKEYGLLNSINSFIFKHKKDSHSIVKCVKISQNIDNEEQFFVHINAIERAVKIMYLCFEEYAEAKQSKYSKSFSQFVSKRSKYYINFLDLWSDIPIKIREKYVNHFIKILEYTVTKFSLPPNFCGSTRWKLTWNIIPIVWLIQFLDNSCLYGRSAIFS